jgi:hypothetical protein
MIEWTFLGRVGIVAAFFIVGCVEAWLYKRPAIPCITWTLGLGPLVIWIAHPLSLWRLALSFFVLFCAILLMWHYYRRASNSI